MRKQNRFFQYLNGLRGENGFTLVELLVTLGIIVALAAVIMPNVAWFVNEGDEANYHQETDNVQTAFDALMVDVGVTQIQPLTSSDNAVNNLVGYPEAFGGGALQYGSPPTNIDVTSYIRGTITSGYYCWNAQGHVVTDPFWDSSTSCP